jgi:hypothetical protein
MELHVNYEPASGAGASFVAKTIDCMPSDSDITFKGSEADNTLVDDDDSPIFLEELIAGISENLKRCTDLHLSKQSPIKRLLEYVFAVSTFARGVCCGNDLANDISQTIVWHPVVSRTF